MQRSVAVGIGIIAVILIAALGLYAVWQRPRGEANLEMSVPQTVRLGEAFNADLAYANHGTGSVYGAKITVQAPEGVAFVGKPADLRYVDMPIGTIGADGSGKVSVKMISMSGEQTIKRISAKLAYSTDSGQSTSFESLASGDTEIGEAAVSLSVQAPDAIFGGQSFTMTVTAQNNSDLTFSGLRLKADYAPAFQYSNSDPAPKRGNNQWDLGSLRKGEKRSIKITGTVVGQAETYFQLRTVLYADMNGQGYQIAAQDSNLSISRSPLAIGISMNGQGFEGILKTGDTAKYKIVFKNNSNVALQNVRIEATAQSQMFIYAKAHSDAVYDSRVNTFSWSPANAPELARLDPGKQGSVDINIPILENFPIYKASDKNFTAKLNVKISSPTVPEGTGGKTESATSIENKFGGDIALASISMYKDAASGVANKGPFPPRANQATQYTIHWKLQNQATDMSAVKVSASLQSNTKFIKVVKTTIGSLQFDPASGQVTWDIANLPATRGMLNDPVEAIFQIENVPAVNQVQQTVVLMGETSLQATDMFVNKPVSKTAKEVTTKTFDSGRDMSGQVLP